MKTADAVPVVLTVHETQAGQYVIRVGDLKWRRLVVEVAKLLPDAESLVVITPDDVKVLKLRGEAEVEADQDPREPGDLPIEETGETTDADQAQAEAEQEAHALPNQDNGNGATPAVRRRKPREPIAGHDETCMRCNGLGKTQVLMPDGGSAETACPICKGAGVMRRYGARR